MVDGTIKAGDTVELQERPTGCTSSHYDLTVGNHYLCKGFAGSCIITTSNKPGEDAWYWRGRVQKVPTPSQSLQSPRP